MSKKKDYQWKKKSKKKMQLSSEHLKDVAGGVVEEKLDTTCRSGTICLHVP
jgi:hypothetical protein